MRLSENLKQRAYFHFLRHPRELERLVRWKWNILGRARRPVRHGLPAPLRVSLTSYPARFGVLGTTLRCLLMQTLVPDDVTLWVADADLAKLPRDVRELERFGLRIRTCRDLRSYKKIIPALEEDPESIWVTCDDDCYYAPRWLETLVRSWNPEAREIVAHRVRRIGLTESGPACSYGDWPVVWEGTSAHPLYLSIGVGGVLYPPKCFAPEVLDESLFRRLCPLADDVWLWWMIRRNDYIVRKASGRWRQILWDGSQNTALHLLNVDGSGNDLAVRNLTEHFGFPDALSAGPAPVNVNGVAAVRTQTRSSNGECCAAGQ